jgi:hypothetical protein
VEAAQLSYTCHVCGRTSHHPTDVAEGYCGACHTWTRGCTCLWQYPPAWMAGLAATHVPATTPPRPWIAHRHERCPCHGVSAL